MSRGNSKVGGHDITPSPTMSTAQQRLTVRKMLGARGIAMMNPFRTLLRIILAVLLPFTAGCGGGSGSPPPPPPLLRSPFRSLVPRTHSIRERPF